MRARRYGAVLAALVMAGAGAAVAVPTVAAAQAAPAAACPTGWGSLPKSGTDADLGSLTGIRTGEHECYDRVVFDVPTAGTDAIGYSVRYVDAVHQDGSGRVIPVSGGAVIEIRVAAPSYDQDTGAATYPGRAGGTLPGVDLTGYRTFRDARFASSFEGDTQVGLGVRARLPFRVFQLPDRLVVDVAHTW